MVVIRPHQTGRDFNGLVFLDRKVAQYNEIGIPLFAKPARNTNSAFQLSRHPIPLYGLKDYPQNHEELGLQARNAQRQSGSNACHFSG